MDELNRKESVYSQVVEGCNWVPEYGAWMVEATPNRPYTGYTTDLLRVERNMRLRRKRILTVLDENEISPTVSTFPLLGVLGDDGSVPPVPVGGPRTESEYIGDGIINPHPRFGTLTVNIRQRRGSKVNIRVPLFRDRNTPEYAGFVAPMGDVDGCCGSDSQQVSPTEKILDRIFFRFTVITHYLPRRRSSGGMVKVMPPRKRMVEIDWW
jgi:glutamate--cysteine ligase catalytic subunit